MTPEEKTSDWAISLLLGFNKKPDSNAFQDVRMFCSVCANISPKEAFAELEAKLKKEMPGVHVMQKAFVEIDAEGLIDMRLSPSRN